VNSVFDNCMSYDLAQALSILGKNVGHVSAIPGLGGGALDPVIYDYVGPRDLRLVSVDHAMKRTPAYVADIRRLGVGLFLVDIGKSRQLKAWGICKLMFKAWDNMENFDETNSPPYIALVKHNGQVVKFH